MNDQSFTSRKKPKFNIDKKLYGTFKLHFGRNFIIVILTCVIILLASVLLFNVLISKYGKEGNIQGVRESAFNKGLEVCEMWVSDEFYLYASREFAASDTLSESRYTNSMEELEALCKSAPEEEFYDVVRKISGVNLKAAGLYASGDTENADLLHKDSIEFFQMLKKLRNENELSELSKALDRYNSNGI